jgi:TorA maturation chaperone TorD
VVQHQHSIADEDAQWCRIVSEFRSQAYWFLSAFFLEAPTADSLRTLQSNLRTCPRDVAEHTEPLLAELEALLEPEGDLTGFAVEANVEYTRLFHGLKQFSGLAPPYESVHRESRLIGETTREVTAAYADAGYACIHEPAGPQDHLGTELRFLSLLCFEESQSWSSGNAEAARMCWARQSDFLTKHALAWIPAYCEMMEAESVVKYYRVVASLTRRTLEHDYRVLRELRSQFGPA